MSSRNLLIKISWSSAWICLKRKSRSATSVLRLLFLFQLRSGNGWNRVYSTRACRPVRPKYLWGFFKPWARFFPLSSFFPKICLESPFSSLSFSQFGFPQQSQAAPTQIISTKFDEEQISVTFETVEKAEGCWITLEDHFSCWQFISNTSQTKRISIQIRRRDRKRTRWFWSPLSLRLWRYRQDCKKSGSEHQQCFSRREKSASNSCSGGDSLWSRRERRWIQRRLIGEEDLWIFSRRCRRWRKRLRRWIRRIRSWCGDGQGRILLCKDIMNFCK